MYNWSFFTRWRSRWHCNIFTGKVATNNVNVDKSVDDGLSQMQSFEKNWSAVSHDSLSRRVEVWKITLRSLRAWCWSDWWGRKGSLMHSSRSGIQLDSCMCIKSGTRSIRAGEHWSRRHKLTLQTPLPPQKIILTATENKVQLIDVYVICWELQEFGIEHKKPDQHRLVVRGKNGIPVD